MPAVDRLAVRRPRSTRAPATRASAMTLAREQGRRFLEECNRSSRPLTTRERWAYNLITTFVADAEHK